MIGSTRYQLRVESTCEDGYIRRGGDTGRGIRGGVELHTAELGGKCENAAGWEAAARRVDTWLNHGGSQFKGPVERVAVMRHYSLGFSLISAIT